MTEYYLFGWILKADIPPDNNKPGRWEYHKLTRDNIREFQYALVSRNDIMKYLEKNGWTLDILAKQDEAIRNRGYVKKPKEFINGVSFFYTNHNNKMSEKPINLLLKKETYIELSVLNGIIRK